MKTKLLYSLTFLLFFFCKTNAQTIPEAAREKYVMAITLRDQAKNASDYDSPIAKFKDAIVLAPTWAEAYKELGLTLELAGKFDEAITYLNKYISLNPLTEDARKAQDEIYIIKAKKEKANSPEALEAQAAIKAQTQEKRFEGTWQRSERYGDNTWHVKRLHVKHLSGDNWNISESQDGGDEFPYAQAHGIQVVGSELRFTSYRGEAICGTHEVRGTVSADGLKLSLDFRLMPLNPNRPLRCPLPEYYGSYVEELTKE